MPWVRARLRDQLVHARADDSGALVSTGGKVEIRYKPHDGRMYEALAKNLVVADPSPLPDATCGPAERPAPRDAAKNKDPAAAPRKRAKAAASADPASASDAAAEHATAISNGDLIAYTDGGCSGNPGPCGLGVVLIHGEMRIEVSEYLGHGTNNIAELTAVLRAVELAAEKPGRLVVHTDSQYSIGVLSKGWKAKANRELITQIRAVLHERPGTRLVYVKGHAGVPLNERADELAGLAMQTRRTTRKDVV